MSAPYTESVAHHGRGSGSLVKTLLKINEHTHTMANRP
jgi:hypothetical protein